MQTLHFDNRLSPQLQIVQSTYPNLQEPVFFLRIVKWRGDNIKTKIQFYEDRGWSWTDFFQPHSLSIFLSLQNFFYECLFYVE